ncbi:MAG TPA: hypothetical protein VKA84_18895 [Gemmatimonadaceae bacterium]|nr:hypothetical protein [Gemmatimonadaceae bacterium]
MRTHRTARLAGQRRGFALALALVAIVVIGALIAGAFFASTQDFRVGRNTLIEQRAFSVAEFGLNREIAQWDTKRNLPYAGLDASGNLVGGMATGSIDANNVYVDAGDTARVKITRLSENSFWVVSEGHASMGNKMLESIRRTTMLVRTAYPTIKTDAAIVTGGSINISGAAKVSGNNTPPPGWKQCDSIGGHDTAAVLAGPNATVTINSSNNMPSNYGVVRSTDAADSNTYVRFGSETWNSLVKNADIKLPPEGDGTIDFGNDIAPVAYADGKTCNTTLQTNWGEPWRAGINGHLLSNVVAACNTYYPIIYAPQSLHLNKQGRGQGVLLVNGSLELNGGFEWYGVIVVRDDITKGNGTAAIYGSVLARNATLTDGGNIINGTQDVSYSKCAIESALRGSAVLVKVPQRAWAQLF